MVRQILLALLLVLGPALAEANEILDRFVEGRVAQILVDRTDGTIISCTAWGWPGLRHIAITAAHCAEDVQHAWVIGSKNRSQAHVLARHLPFDAAVIWSPAFTLLDRFQPGTVEEGEPVRGYGYPHHAGLTGRGGLLNRYAGPHLVMGMALQHGVSGGPVLNQHGEIVGMATATDQHGRERSLAVSFHALRAWVMEVALMLREEDR